VHIISEAFLVAAGREHAPATRQLDAGRKFVKKATWHSLADVRQPYPDTDAVKVRSGRQVLIFNVRRNDYRLIVATHFNCQIVYTLRFMTHAEYSKDRWKDTL
jgi:mRNA interferase HigB